jgi:protein Tex
LGFEILTEIARELSIAPGQAQNTVALLQEGATVPFIARYRKERTGSLDETQIRQVEERWRYYGELEERRQAILASIEEQGKLTDALRAQIEACRQKQELEDLYLPFRPKRRTRATIAREKGLEPLAERIWAQREPPEVVARAAAEFVDAARGVASVEEALAGAQDILAERIADDAGVRAEVRETLRRTGTLAARRRSDADDPEGKFAQYYDHAERLDRIPHHRVLALDRGERAEVLRVSLEGPDDEIVARLRRRFAAPSARFSSPVVAAAVEDAYKRLIRPAIERELRAELTEAAGAAAIALFSRNLRQLLLQPPVRDAVVIGVDPGLRTGCKVAVVDATGKFREHTTLYPHPPHNRRTEATRALLDLVRRHGATLVAVGNGTASRETMQWVEQSLTGLDDARASAPAHSRVASRVRAVTVNESGASVYSASPVAIEEFPDLDVTVRGAISIARRLQDPLAELVKIDPKSIGVGQYQHDVDQKQLKEGLDGVVESCVNHVGVDLNTASASLLAYVAGIGPQLARGIVRWRDEHGAFAARAQLLKVPKLGPKAFQQAAGFLRVHGGPQPLDASAVHPESYPVVERMAARLGLRVEGLIRNTEAIRRIDPREFVDGETGLPTLQDILAELEKPGRDPRGEVQSVAFRDDVHALEDLREGMVLTGVVTNVTDFGAFVDVGVHQDGLVHISQMADRRIRHPSEVCAIGQAVQVRVLGVEPERRRISLSMKGVGNGA